MTQAYEKSVFEIEIVLEDLPVEQKKIPFTLNERNHENKAQLLKKWKKSEGYYYLHPEKFEFSLKNLK